MFRLTEDILNRKLNFDAVYLSQTLFNMSTYLSCKKNNKNTNVKLFINERQLKQYWLNSLPKDNFKTKPTGKDKVITKECVTKPEEIISHDLGTSLSKCASKLR